MTREQQRQLKELNTQLSRIIKELCAQYKIKKKDGSLFYKKENMFYKAIISITTPSDDVWYCETEELIKPLYLDDILWELLDMESNINEADSLRAVGAFALHGVRIYKNRIILKSRTIDELREILESYVKHFADGINDATIDDFINNIDVNSYHGVEMKSIYLIHEGCYREALDTVGNKRGCFNNKGIDINDAIREYCRNHI